MRYSENKKMAKDEPEIVTYRIDREAETELMTYSLFADGINWIPGANMILGPIMQGLIAFYFASHKVNPISEKSIAETRAENATNKKKKRKRKPPKITNKKRKLLGRGARFFLTLAAESSPIPLLSVAPWTTINTLATIAESREEDKEEAKTKQKEDKEELDELAVAKQNIEKEKREQELLQGILAQQNALDQVAEIANYSEELKRAGLTNEARNAMRAQQDISTNEIGARTVAALQDRNKSLMRTSRSSLASSGAGLPVAYRTDDYDHDYSESLRRAVVTNEDRQTQRRIAQELQPGTTQPPVSGDGVRQRIPQLAQNVSPRQAQSYAREAKRLNALSAGDYAQIAAGSGFTENPEAKSEFLQTLRNDHRTGAISREEFTNMVNTFPRFTGEDKQVLLKETANRFDAANIATRYSGDTNQLREAITTAMQKMVVQKRAEESTRMSPETVNMAVNLALKRIQEAPLAWEPIDDSAINDAVEEVLAILKREHTGEHLEIRSEPNTNPLNAS